MSLKKYVKELQDIMEVRGKYSVQESTSLKDGEMLYNLMYDDSIEYTGTEKEIVAFIKGAIYATLA